MLPGTRTLTMREEAEMLTLQKISGHLDINQISSAYYRESPADIAKRL